MTDESKNFRSSSIIRAKAFAASPITGFAVGILSFIYAVITNSAASQEKIEATARITALQDALAIQTATVSAIHTGMMAADARPDLVDEVIAKYSPSDLTGSSTGSWQVIPKDHFPEMFPEVEAENSVWRARLNDPSDWYPYQQVVEAVVTEAGDIYYFVEVSTDIGMNPTNVLLFRLSGKNREQLFDGVGGGLSRVVYGDDGISFYQYYNAAGPADFSCSYTFDFDAGRFTKVHYLPDVGYEGTQDVCNPI